jgi:hypothetical protein
MRTTKTRERSLALQLIFGHLSFQLTNPISEKNFVGGLQLINFFFALY